MRVGRAAESYDAWARSYRSLWHCVEELAWFHCARLVIEFIAKTI
jgi:hypothetical protein